MENNKKERIQLVELVDNPNGSDNIPNNTANYSHYGTGNMNFPNQQQYVPFEVSKVISDYNNLTRQNVSLLKQLGNMEKELISCKSEINNLKEGLIGSDWQLIQDDTKNIILMTDGKRHEVLVNAAIKKVTPYVFSIAKKTVIVFEIEFRLSTGEKKISCLKQDDLESPKEFIKKLEKVGIHIRIKRSNSIKCQILKRHILEKITDDNIIYIPYFSGWNDHVFCYCTEESNRRLNNMEIELPYMRRFFSKNKIDFVKIKENLELFNSNFGQEETSLILAITAGSLLYTELFNIGYYLDALFVLDTGNTCMPDIRKWMQPWKKEICCSLSNKKTLIKALQESKDETIFLIDEGTTYSLKLDLFLKNLSEDNEIIIENEINSLRSVPILITSRRDVWKLRNLRLINLSFHGNNRIWTEKEIVSYFWRYFCDSLNGAYDIWMKQLLSLRITPYSGEIFGNVYNWIVAAYNILFPCLNVILEPNSPYIMMPQEFEKYMDTWLYKAEQQGHMDLAEEFIFGVNQLKYEGRLEFVESCCYQNHSGNNYTIAFDQKFIYISNNTFSSIVNNLLPGCSNAEVYKALVEEGSAKKGDGEHLFPKCSIGFSNKRERLAAIHRQLLLSDAEYLLEV